MSGRRTFRVRYWADMVLVAGSVGVILVTVDVARHPPDGTPGEIGGFFTFLAAEYPWLFVGLGVVLLIRMLAQMARGKAWLDDGGVYLPNHPWRPFLPWDEIAAIDVERIQPFPLLPKTQRCMFVTDTGRRVIGVLGYLKDPQAYTRALVEMAPAHVRLGGGLYAHARRIPRQRGHGPRTS